MQFSLKAKKNPTSHARGENKESTWGFLPKKEHKPEEGILKSQRVFKSGAGIDVSAPGPSATLRTRSSHDCSNSAQIITVLSHFSSQFDLRP